MLLESRLDETSFLYIDTPAAGGFEKGETDLGFHPDQVLDNVVKVAAIVAARMADAAAHATAASGSIPSKVSLSFGIKVDANAVVSVSSDLNAAHFQVTTEWAPKS